MPFPVDNIRAICAQKGTSLKQIEKELGIGNGVIARWENKKGSPPYDRIIAIAEHLNVSVSELTGEPEQKETPTINNDGGLTETQKLAVDFIYTLTDEQLSRFIKMGKAAFEKEKL